MKRQRENGMTIMEVIIAITVLLIGVGFVVKSNAVSYKYRGQYEKREQMIFFAAGQIESMLETDNTVSAAETPFDSFVVSAEHSPLEMNGHLEKVKVEVNSPTGSSSPVTIYSYRLIQ